MRYLISCLILIFYISPASAQQTVTLFDDSITVTLPDGFEAEAGPGNSEWVEVARFVRPSTDREIEETLSTDRVSKEFISSMSDKVEAASEVIVVFRDFPFPVRLMTTETEEDQKMVDFVETNSVEGWVEFFDFAFSGFFGPGHYLKYTDQERNHHAFVTSNADHAIHIMEVADRPVAIMTVNSLELEILHQQFNDDEASSWGDLTQEETRELIQRAAMLDTVQGVYDSMQISVARSSWFPKPADPH